MLPHRILDYKTFRALYVLLQDKADSLGDAAIAITERILPETDSSWEYSKSQFILLIAPGLRVMLIGTNLERSNHRGRDRNSGREVVQVQVDLTFDIHPITVFLKQLRDRLSEPTLVLRALRKITRHPPTNSGYLQSELMLQILVQQETSQSQIQELPPSRSINLAQQERLFYQTIVQMHEGTRLPTILSQAVEEGRSVLQVDRLLIYQFNIFPGNETNAEGDRLPKSGYITYEAKAGTSIPPVLHLTEEKSCFCDDLSLLQKYEKGAVVDIDDVEVSYEPFPCLLNLLRSYSIRAKLVVPILINHRTWGLLIAHQCYYPRRWLESEKTILKRLADYLAIAIEHSAAKEMLAANLDRENSNEKNTENLHGKLLETQIENRIKSEFLAAISHELRTPLTYIIGMSATLLRLGFSPEAASVSLSPTKQREYLQKIQDSGKHLLDLINTILELSELEAGKSVLNIRTFSLTHLIQSCQNAMQKSARDRGINLVSEIRLNDREDRFKADQSRVQQILNNLLNNALKFTETGGEVSLRVWREEDTAILQVSDTGIGIEKQEFPFLFEKFHQLEAAYERQYPGMGLGLALTRQLVELHGGIIEVDSSPGVGSVFTVSLPSQPQDSLGAKSAINSPSLKTVSGTIPLGRLVLIENDEQMAWELCDLLTAAGYQAIWLLDGSTVAQQVKVLRPLAIITETQLPDMSLQELIGILRSSTSTYKIKILAIANASEREVLTSGDRMQPDAYLDKPLRFEQLLQTLSNILRPAL